MTIQWLSRRTSSREVERRLVAMTDGTFEVVAAEVFDHPEAKPLQKDTGDAEKGTVTGPWLLGPEDEVRAELARWHYEEYTIQMSAGMNTGERSDP